MQLTHRIRELLNRDLPALQRVVDEAEFVLRDLEGGMDETPVDPMRHTHPGTPNRRAAPNRPNVSPFPAPARQWDTRRLRKAWNPLRDNLMNHMHKERTILYPLAMRVLEGGMKQRKMLAIPIAQMVSEHQELRVRFPAFRSESLGYDPISRQLGAVQQCFELHTRREELEIFPELLRLVDDQFDIMATPLHAHYRTADDIGRNLRRSSRSQVPVEPRIITPEPEPTLVDRMKSWFTRS